MSTRATSLFRSVLIDSMDAVYDAELRELKSAEMQACSLADEIWVTLLNGLLADRVSQYVSALRRRTAEHAALQPRAEDSRSHRNAVMRSLVQETNRTAESYATNVRDVVLAARLQHVVHYLIASYGSIAAHARMLGLSEQAARFAEHAESDRRFDVDLSELVSEVVAPSR